MTSNNYKLVLIITSLLLVLSTSLSFINYKLSLNSTEEHLKTQSLPLSLDNIYTEIQKHVVQPYLVSSMMANDTFLKDWLEHDEKDSKKIIKYLNSVKNKYSMFSTFLVSEQTKNYYTQNGFVEKVREDNPTNKWYFNFRNSQKNHEINLDFNENLTNSMMMFINYKIYNNTYQMLGATGIALKISYIDDMLKTFRIKHKFLVTFYNKNGDIVLAENKHLVNKSIDDNPKLKKYKDEILSKGNNTIELNNDGDRYILNTKYIPELQLYLVVQAKISDFTKDVKNILYFNILISILISAIVLYIIIYMIKRYHKKLTFLSEFDPLTNIHNRRVFEERFEKFILLSKRNKQKISLLFLDVDNFKNINDKFGHDIGDKVLKEISNLLKSNIRETDLVARWGGEEFVIAYLDSDLEKSKVLAENIRLKIQDDQTLQKLIGTPVTASIGITQLKESDSFDTILSRADELMYNSKNSGKNKVSY